MGSLDSTKAQSGLIQHGFRLAQNLKLTAWRHEFPPLARSAIEEEPTFADRTVRFHKKCQPFFEIEFVGFAVHHNVEMPPEAPADFAARPELPRASPVGF